ncbi:MAG: NUDIX hydrolase [Beutenbergiaceae bacterium]
MPQARVIVSAVVLRDERNRVLTVRKRGTHRFMLPGGKPDLGEDAAATALREVREEIGARLDRPALTLLGVFTAAAANEPDTRVEGTIFSHPALVQPHPAAEIAQIRWLDLTQALPDDLAPLLAEQVLPRLGLGSTAGTP